MEIREVAQPASNIASRLSKRDEENGDIGKVLEYSELRSNAQGGALYHLQNGMRMREYRLGEGCVTEVKLLWVRELRTILCLSD